MTDQGRDMLTPEERAGAEREAEARAAERAEKKRARRGSLNRTRKGKRGEAKGVELFGALGLHRVRRQPRSGSIEGLPHDVVGTMSDGSTLTAEAKQFATSKWRSLEKYRAGADMLLLYEDQQAPGQAAPEGRVFTTETVLKRLIADAYDRGYHQT